MINDTLSLASVQKVTLLLFLSAFVAEANHTQAADDQKGSHSEWSMAVQTGLIHTVEGFVAFFNERVPKTPPIHTLQYCSEQLEGIERDDCAEASSIRSFVTRFRS